MAKVTCELNNLVLLENPNLSYVDGEFACNVINTNLSNHLSASAALACPNGCKNGLHANVNSTSVNSCLTSLPNSHCQQTASNGPQLGSSPLNSSHPLNKSQLSASARSNSAHLGHSKRDDHVKGNPHQQTSINKTLLNNSIHFEVVRSNRFRERKADLSFPRKFVNVQKKEYNEDGILVGTKRVIKTCVLQPSLFENIPPSIYFGLEDELSRFF